MSVLRGLCLQYERELRQAWAADFRAKRVTALFQSLKSARDELRALGAGGDEPPVS